jgi:hypothetical protein
MAIEDPGSPAHQNVDLDELHKRTSSFDYNFDAAID